MAFFCICSVAALPILLGDRTLSVKVSMQYRLLVLVADVLELLAASLYNFSILFSPHQVTTKSHRVAQKQSTPSDMVPEFVSMNVIKDTHRRAMSKCGGSDSFIKKWVSEAVKVVDQNELWNDLEEVSTENPQTSQFVHDVIMYAEKLDGHIGGDAALRSQITQILGDYQEHLIGVGKLMTRIKKKLDGHHHFVAGQGLMFGGFWTSSVVPPSQTKSVHSSTKSCVSSDGNLDMTCVGVKIVFRVLSTSEHLVDESISMDFVGEVQSRFEDDQSVFDEFVTIIRQNAQGEIDEHSLKERIDVLFSGHGDLLARFETTVWATSQCRAAPLKKMQGGTKGFSERNVEQPLQIARLTVFSYLALHSSAHFKHFMTALQNVVACARMAVRFCQTLTKEFHSWTMQHRLDSASYLRRRNASLAVPESILVDIELFLFAVLYCISIVCRKQFSKAPLPATSEKMAQDLSASPGRQECSICLDHEAQYAMIPCGHLCMCESCAVDAALNIRDCPICRARVHKKIKIYF
tara:strand:- start:986 stop:2548 length:1563 start_codon:yes stop_codon:yes gene_type:complete